MSNALGVVLFLATLASDDFCTKQLDRQLAWHRKYGLPLPPPDASLVWYVPKPRWVYQNGKMVTEPGTPALGFSLDGRTLWGYPGEPVEVASITVVKPDLLLLQNDVFAAWQLLALACHERGWEQLARAAIRRHTLANKRWDTEVMIARDAWNHWEKRIHGDPGTPLPLVAKYLRRVCPLSRDEDSPLLRSVELAITPHNSTPGSEDALIDELVEMSGREGYAQTYRTEPQYRAIVRRGLAAVPALIAHLDDDRITRAARLRDFVGHENFRVKDIALDILVQLHGGPFAVPEDTRDELLKAIGIWLAEANKLGEGKYLASRILGTDEDDDHFHSELLWLLTEKYPERLPDLFREVIDTRPNQRRFAKYYAKAIDEGPLSPGDKRMIFTYAAKQDHPTVRVAGLYYLRPLDPKLTKELVLSGLANLPTSYPETELVGIVAEGTDAEEWQALALAVRRADVEGRFGLLWHVRDGESTEARKHRIAFLAEYLTDDEIYGGTRYSIGFQRIEVRNFVAVRLSWLFKIDAKPDEDWTAEQWARLRAKVQVRVKQELDR